MERFNDWLQLEAIGDAATSNTEIATPGPIAPANDTLDLTVDDWTWEAAADAELSAAKSRLLPTSDPRVKTMRGQPRVIDIPRAAFPLAKSLANGKSGFYQGLRIKTYSEMVAHGVFYQSGMQVRLDGREGTVLFMVNFIEKRINNCCSMILVGMPGRASPRLPDFDLVQISSTLLQLSQPVLYLANPLLSGLAASGVAALPGQLVSKFGELPGGTGKLAVTWFGDGPNQNKDKNVMDDADFEALRVAEEAEKSSRLRPSRKRRNASASLNLTNPRKLQFTASSRARGSRSASTSEDDEDEVEVIDEVAQLNKTIEELKKQIATHKGGCPRKQCTANRAALKNRREDPPPKKTPQTAKAPCHQCPGKDTRLKSHEAELQKLRTQAASEKKAHASAVELHSQRQLELQQQLNEAKVALGEVQGHKAALQKQLQDVQQQLSKPAEGTLSVEKLLTSVGDFITKIQPKATQASVSDIASLIALARPAQEDSSKSTPAYCMEEITRFHGLFTKP